MNVVGAHVRRAVNKDGARCGEVEVRTDDPARAEMLVYFSASQDNDYDMHSIVHNDAAAEIDWYDNNMHNAFEEISGNLFESDEMKTKWGEREVFKEAILSFGNVRADLAEIIH
ncbi:hypothetical protein [Paenibacillus abyssi]|uniref:Uncharacterized protein n=1 Tax=Paenibacillus abyssi TaxID=1340531 RepID=A0A917G316_9BACL|nr:hypothetical protein [Paenibacillus abyssi]GGG20673.1 hypothetical protein GCM10010916_41730 [Paenibacillus abyssi]